MDICFQEDLNYLQPGLLENIHVCAHSDGKIGIVKVKNYFSKKENFNCKQYLICFRNLYFSNPGFREENSKSPIFKEVESREKKYKVSKNSLFLKDLCTSGKAKMIYGIDNKSIREKNIEINSDLLTLFNQFMVELIERKTGYKYLIQSLDIQIFLLLLRIIRLNLENEADLVFLRKMINNTWESLIEIYGKSFLIKDIKRKYNHSSYHLFEKRKIAEGENKTGYMFKEPGKKDVEEVMELFAFKKNSMIELIFDLKFDNNSYLKIVSKET
ncbi:MAG: hypothetical protein ACOC4G_08935 [Bacillota bacterium]